jgi:hypothetical protein
VIRNAPRGNQQIKSVLLPSTNCTLKALGVGAAGFLGVFVPGIPPEVLASTDPTGFALDTAKSATELLKNPGVRAVILTNAVVVAKGLAPVAADALDFVPVIGEGVLALQVGYGLYRGGKDYMETIDECIGGG